MHVNSAVTYTYTHTDTHAKHGVAVRFSFKHYGCTWITDTLTIGLVQTG